MAVLLEFGEKQLNLLKIVPDSSNYANSPGNVPKGNEKKEIFNYIFKIVPDSSIYANSPGNIPKGKTAILQARGKTPTEMDTKSGKKETNKEKDMPEQKRSG
jgi:hypothetical protein